MDQGSERAKQTERHQSNQTDVLSERRSENIQEKAGSGREIRDKEEIESFDTRETSECLAPDGATGRARRSDSPGLAVVISVGRRH